MGYFNFFFEIMQSSIAGALTDITNNFPKDIKEKPIRSSLNKEFFYQQGFKKNVPFQLFPSKIKSSLQRTNKDSSCLVSEPQIKKKSLVPASPKNKCQSNSPSQCTIPLLVKNEKQKMNEDAKNISIMASISKPYEKEKMDLLEKMRSPIAVTNKLFAQFEEELFRYQKSFSQEKMIKDNEKKQHIRQLDILKAKIEQLEESVNQGKSTCQKANLQVQKLSKSKRTLEKVIKKLKNNIVLRGEAEIRMSLNQYKQANKYLLLEKQSIEAKAQIKAMKEDNIDLKLCIKKLQKELKNAATDFEKQLNQSLFLEHEKTKASEIIFIKEREETEQKIQQYKFIQRSTQEKNEKLENQLNETKEKMQQLTKDMETKSKEEEEIRKERDTIKKQLTIMPQEFTEKEKLLEKLSEKNRELNAERQIIQQVHQTYLLKSKKNNEKMGIDLKKSIEQEKKLKSQLEVIASECEEKEAKIKKLDEQLKLFGNTREKMELLQKRLQCEMAKGKQIQTELEKKTNENEKIKAQMATLKGELKHKRKKRKRSNDQESSEFDESSGFDNEDWTMDMSDGFFESDTGEREEKLLKELMKARKKNQDQEEKIAGLITEKSVLAAKVVLTTMIDHNEKKQKQKHEKINKGNTPINKSILKIDQKDGEKEEWTSLHSLRALWSLEKEKKLREKEDQISQLSEKDVELRSKLEQMNIEDEKNKKKILEQGQEINLLLKREIMLKEHVFEIIKLNEKQIQEQEPKNYNMEEKRQTDEKQEVTLHQKRNIKELLEIKKKLESYFDLVIKKEEIKQKNRNQQKLIQFQEEKNEADQKLKDKLEICSLTNDKKMKKDVELEKINLKNEKYKKQIYEQEQTIQQLLEKEDVLKKQIHNITVKNDKQTEQQQLNNKKLYDMIRDGRNKTKKSRPRRKNRSL